MEQNDSKNLIIAMLLSMMILLGWYTFFGPTPEEIEAQQQAAETAQAETSIPIEGADGASAVLSREAAIANGGARVAIDTPRLQGSVSLKGGRIDDLTLKNYDLTIEEDSPKVNLLSPLESDQAYFIQTRFLRGDDVAEEDIPTPNTEWTVKSGDILTSEAPIVLEWRSPIGLVYEREISVDENYMFTITDRVDNQSGAPATLRPYAYVTYLGQDSRNDPIEPGRTTQSGFILHQGAIYNSDGTVKEVKFKDIAEDAIDVEVLEKGWTGLTTKYWMSVIIPENGVSYESRLTHVASSDLYNAATYFNTQTLADGETLENAVRVFSGAKEVELIRDYRDDLEIDRFDDTVDWGWFWFLTKPIFTLLHNLFVLVGNMGLAIIALTFIIKAILFPLAYRSYVSMSRMKKLQPEMEKIKEAAGDDRGKLQQMTMELYRKEKVNPVSGCLPILLQIPIFFSLYKVLYVTTELRHAKFFGPWQDLSAGDPTSIVNLFGLLPWGAPDPNSFFALIALGILPILLGISMYLTQKLNPAPTDPTQAAIFRWMPWVFMFMMGGFAAGLIVYWITNNMLTFIQQYTIMRREGVKPDLLGNMFGRKKA